MSNLRVKKKLDLYFWNSMILVQKKQKNLKKKLQNMNIKKEKFYIN